MNEDELDDELLDLMRQRRKIQGIKLLRERTGRGLKEAKEEYERLERVAIEKGLVEASAEGGCGGSASFLLLILAGAAGGGYFLFG